MTDTGKRLRDHPNVNDPFRTDGHTLRMEAADEIERLRDNEQNALVFAQSLATELWKQHWKQDTPDWVPQKTLLGVLLQIDNATAGLKKP